MKNDLIVLPEMIAMMRDWEGVRLRAYTCSSGVWTIGIGQTFYEDGAKVRRGDVITEARAEALFEWSLARFAKKVEALIENPETDNFMFSALVSLAFNIGEGSEHSKGRGLYWSKALRYHNLGQYIKAAESFMRYVYSKGEKLGALVRRRKDEKQFYLRGVKNMTVVEAIINKTLGELQRRWYRGRGEKPDIPGELYDAGRGK